MRYIASVLITSTVLIPISSASIYFVYRQMVMGKRSQVQSWVLMSAYMLGPMTLFLLLGFYMGKGL